MAPLLGLPPVRIRGPTLWCIAAVGTIYLGAAAFEIRQDAATVQRLKRARYRYYSASPVAMEELQAVRMMVKASRGRNPLYTPATPEAEPASSPTAFLREELARFPETGKLMVGIMSINTGVFALERLMPGMADLFSHLPAAAGGANYTLLTSAFGHVGLAHLALNMYGVFQFLPPVAYSAAFDGSGSHLAAFYLSSGILAAHAFHLAAVWPRPLDRLVPARGASGAVMAVVGAFAMAYPQQRLGIILLPFSLPASDFLVCLALFETYGLFVGFKRLPLAHAAHLAGLGIGSAYVYFDARHRLWEPLRRWTFKNMRRLNIV